MKPPGKLPRGLPAIVLLLAQPAIAQLPYTGSTQDFYPGPMVDFATGQFNQSITNMSFELSREALRQSQRGPARARPNALQPSTPRPVASGQTPAAGAQPRAIAGNPAAPPTAALVSAAKEFAARFPAEQRARVERDYVRVMEDYKGVEKRLGFPENDVAGAMATFVLTSYIAFRQQGDVPLTYALPIAQQLRTAMPHVRALAQASPEMQRKLYDVFVFSGVKIAGNARYYLKEHPDPQKQALLKQVARRHLEGFFGVPAERVQLSASGFALAD